MGDLNHFYSLSYDFITKKNEVMGKTILYPFRIKEKNTFSYLQTLHLAQKIKAKVVCFSTLENEDTLDDAYLHLLALNGAYQAKFNHWKTLPVTIEQQILPGAFRIELSKIFIAAPIDYLIHHKNLKEEQLVFVNKFIEKNDLKTSVITFDEA